MNDKRGFLLAEETLKLILAVISIGVLAYLLFALYSSNKDSKELVLAKASLNSFFEATNVQATEIDIYNPSRWYLNSWPNSYTSGALFWKKTEEGKIPVSCSNLGWGSCICLCEDNNPDSCDENGACLENKNSLQFASPIKIENPPVKIQINYEAKEVSKA